MHTEPSKKHLARLMPKAFFTVCNVRGLAPFVKDPTLTARLSLSRSFSARISCSLFLSASFIFVYGVYAPKSSRKNPKPKKAVSLFFWLVLLIWLARCTFTRKVGFSEINLDFKQQLLTGHQRCEQTDGAMSTLACDHVTHT